MISMIGISQQKLAMKVSDILRSDFHHPYAPIKKSTLSNLRAPELASLYGFLTNGIMGYENLVQRPECPIRSPKHQSLATYSYKKAMVEYIQGFGYRLESSPCLYTPAFLEALANYLEQRGKEEKNNGDINVVRMGN